MSNRRLSSAFLLALALALCSSACWTSHPPAAFTPPPPRAEPAPEPIPVLADPPLIASVFDLKDRSNGVAIVPGIGVEVVPNGVPLAPAPVAPKPTPRRNTVTTSPPKSTPAPPTEPQPAPRIGQILPPDKTREYNRALDESLDRVKRVIASLQRKNLTADQMEILNRIQVFERQAEQTREQDLVIAVSLATRADLLAKDLQERVP